MSRIMIIDASPFMRGSLKFLIERAGHEAAGNADNAKEALHLCEQLRPDIVTLDINMGGGEGISILKAIMGVAPSAKIIITCAGGYEDKREEARNLGAVGIIEKPYKYDQVESELERIAKPAKKQ